MRITTAIKTHIKTSVRITPARIPIRGAKSVSSSSAEKSNYTYMNCHDVKQYTLPKLYSTDSNMA